MEPPSRIDLQNLVVFLLIAAGIGLALSMLLLGWVVWRVKRINLPPDADPMTALRATPLLVVLLLDLLDFSLDFLSAPLAWTILSYLGLRSLRTVSVVAAFIPGTQFLPVMTAAWVLARLAKNRF